MVVKARIVEELGESGLRLPTLVGDALQANDQVKFYFSLLQAAMAHADQPDGPADSFRQERLAAGIENPALDTLVQEARRIDPEHLLIADVAAIHDDILRGISQMIAPLLAGGDEAAGLAYQRRLEALRAMAPVLTDDQIPARYIGEMTRGQRGGADSLHLLVMDAHKSLNRLQARIAEQDIDGASVYGIDEADVPLIRGFMAGLNRTAPLKFDHPGLGTSATRSGDRLVIQNDIGTTDAHVLVIHVEDTCVSVTYSDVHPERAAFFRSLFDGTETEWTIRTMHNPELAEGAAFQVCHGTHAAPDDVATAAFLELLGSRLVYLIDWNKARKRLKHFLRKADCLRLLKWGADQDIGHRGFLQLGGETLIFEAIRRCAGVTIRYGERLDDLLGREIVYGFLQGVLRSTSEGLRSGRSVTLIRDEIKAELLNLFQGAHNRLLDLAASHAEISFDLARLLQDRLLELPATDQQQVLATLAHRARQLEQDADALVRQGAEVIRGLSIPEPLTRLLPLADDVTDALEDAAFLAGSLHCVEQPESLVELVQQLAALLVEGSQELIKAIANLSVLEHGTAREDVQAFLQAINQIILIEQRTDSVERRVTERLVQTAFGERETLLYGKVAESFEEAADALAHCAILLRDYAMNDVMGLR